MVTLAPRPRSIRARYTTIVTMLFLIVLAAVGASSDQAIRYKIQNRVFDDTQRIASQWSAAARDRGVPHLIPVSTRVDLIQLVDAHGSVVGSSRKALGRPPLSTVRPPANDRVRRLTAGHLVLTAIRTSPAPDAPVLYAGLPEPSILREHHLEYLTDAGTLFFAGLVFWLTWYTVGRTLRPVAAIRRRMSAITASDLSLRVPVPPGEDEIALLARTANQTLARLEDAVRQQRQFASTASHELRTPITGLRVQLEEALLYPHDIDPHQIIRGALSTTGRLEAIIEDLLLAARLRAADPAPHEPIDLGALVTREAALFHATPVRVHAAPGVGVCGSRIQLIRVLGNLLGNAQRHADTSVEVFVESSGGQAIVAVVDDGTGIAPADRGRVFERFTRLDDGRRRDPGGSGLGLAVSRDIARAHHGTLRVEDSPRGARFVLRLPLLDARHLDTEHADSQRTCGRRAVPSLP
jgi:signal transduction histidine kinase